jgi:hypothetical protein
MYAVDVNPINVKSVAVAIQFIVFGLNVIAVKFYKYIWFIDGSITRKIALFIVTADLGLVTPMIVYFNPKN